MKKRYLFWLFLLLIPFSLAQDDLYSMDSLQLQLTVDGSFALVAEKGGASLKEVAADLLIYPGESERQGIIQWDSEGTIKNGTVSFFWNDQKIEKKAYGYEALIESKSKRLEVQEKVPFPLLPSDIKDVEQYLEPTETIDANYPAIVEKAAELAEGEDDLFKVVFNLASWVEENIKYDLNTVTSAASQKASWVLENRQGVCDEMTSLFVAMARSLGIPARFVSGISYTNSEEVANAVGSNWAGHGWAEVYFPEIGWVSFDVTFNQYGYIDVTHIKLRDGFDPKEPAVKYSWISDGVLLQKGKLDLDVSVEEQGTVIPEQIQLELELLGHELGFGSYNLVKGIVKNTADYYVATALNLAVPKEVEVIGRNRRNILLHPQEIRETFWIVKIPANLEENYVYTFPVRIYSEKNISVDDSFKARNAKTYYSKKDIEELVVQDEEKSYSRKLTFDCQYTKEIILGEEATITCSIKNSGNTNLLDINFCLDSVCELVNLLINQQKSSEIKVKGTEAGFQKIVVSAENDLVEKRMPLEYSVLDQPKIVVETEYPPTVTFGTPLEIVLTTTKDSFSEPEELELTVRGPGFKEKWQLEKLDSQQDLTMQIDGKRFSSTNKIFIKTAWKDKEGNSYSSEKEIIIKSEADSISDRIRMTINWVLNAFG